MADIPHILFPPQLVGTRLLTRDQDSPGEIQACVLNILRTKPGHSDEEDLQGMGLANQAFLKGGPDLDEIQRQIEEYEPRAEPTLTEEQPDLLDDALREIGVQLATSGE